MMNFISILKTINNDQLPINYTNPNETNYLMSKSNNKLIPFYIHKLTNSKITTESKQNEKEFNSYDLNQQNRDASQPIGFLRIQVIKALLDDNKNMIQSHCKPCWKFIYNTTYSNLFEKEKDEKNLPCCICFEDWINFNENSIETRTAHLDRLVRGWKETGLFFDQLSGWRNECYSIYGPKDSISDDDENPNQISETNIAFKIERAAVGLFGFLSFGAHLTAYIKRNGEYFFWIPTRSANKPTWPSKLDNTVAGGITSGETPFETIIRESVEEASFPEDFVRSDVKSTGLISYTHRNQFGWIQPEIQYTFDLELPTTDSNQEGIIIPKPNDGETENFKLLNVEKMFLAIKTNQFKPNCAGVLIDFFVRHGILNQFNCFNQFCLISTFLKSIPDLPLP